MSKTAARLRQIAFADRGPVARSYRKFLGKASITMFALLIISARSCCRCCTCSRPRSSSRARAPRPGAPVYPASPLTGTYQGEPYPIYAVPIPDGTTQQLMLVEKGRESSMFVDPANPGAGPIRGKAAGARSTGTGSSSSASTTS